MPKVLYSNTVFEIHGPVFMKCLFRNIQNQQNLLKNSLRFKKNANFTAKELPGHMNIA